ncbi:MAG: ABC transporter ATP-binding protein/permease [Bacteroidota bacterium]|nr:ABC transporter ATP-binding protein/permease [Bacteroidota bacterium]
MSFDLKSTGKAFDLSVLRRVFALVSPYRGIFFLSVVLTILSAVVGPAVPVVIQKAIDDPILNNDIMGLYWYCAAVLGLLILQAIIMYVQTYYTNWLGQKAVQHLRTGIFSHILGFRQKVYDRTPVGTMITRTVSDVETVNEIFSQGLINIIGDTLQIAVILGIMFYTDWQLALVSLAVFPLLLISAYIFKEKVKVSFQDVRAQVARMNAFLQEHITGMQVVQIFNRENHEMKKFEKINEGHKDANIRSIFYYSVFFPVIEVLSAIAIALLVWWGARDILNGEQTIGTLVLFILLINLLFRPIRQIADKFNTLQMGMVASDRIFKVMDLEDHIPDTGTTDKPFDGTVEFKNVWFAYNDEDWVLKDVSFKVERGDSLAIVGHTGAGKTSITNLINRQYVYNKGAICVDDIPVEEYTLHSLRRQIAVVLQDVFLFSDTIENNIRLYNPAISNEQIIEAAHMVGAHRFIEKLPGAYKHRVQERGANLSTGQRQLISFIRAVIQDPAILILDEATSSIDQETEELIQEATDVLLKDRTSIIIAHRLSTIQHAAQIIVMEKGKIKERGRHDELLNQGGLYKQLYEFQFTELML